MARINKKKHQRKQAEEGRKARWFVFYNGGGTKRYRIKCERCGRTHLGGEQYNSGEQVTPCLLCGNETALYDPQLL